MGRQNWTCQNPVGSFTDLDVIGDAKGWHLEHVYRIFGHLKLHPKRKLAFDAQHPRTSEKMSRKYDWTDFYRGVKEAIPGDTSRPRGNMMSTYCFADASHGSDRETRRAQTAILIFCNRSPIL